MPDFADIGAACLRMVANNHAVELSEDAAKKAIAPMRTLPPHPVVGKYKPHAEVYRWARARSMPKFPNAGASPLMGGTWQERHGSGCFRQQMNLSPRIEQN